MSSEIKKKKNRHHTKNEKSLRLIYENSIHGGIVEIGRKNIKKVLASNEVVFIQFYTDWDGFSKLMWPAFNKASDELSKAGYGPGKLLMGKISSDDERALKRTFGISYYPTLLLFKNGTLKEQYRGGRSVEDFTEFIKKQFPDPIK